MSSTVVGTELVVRRVAGGVCRLALNDPRKANVLSLAMIERLMEALVEARSNRAVGVVIIEANGAVFCAGHDLGELRASEDRAEHQRLFASCSALMAAIASSPKPVIAKVQGAAVAAGCQLVASCDLAYAARGARFAVSGIDLGLFCSTPSVALSRTVGRKAALEMLLTGRVIGAGEAAAIGLVNRAVADGELDGVVDAAAAAIAGKAPDAIALGKALFNRQIAMPIDDAYALAGEAMAENLGMACAKSGIDAFLGRRAR